MFPWYRNFEPVSVQEEMEYWRRRTPAPQPEQKPFGTKCDAQPEQRPYQKTFDNQTVRKKPGPHVKDANIGKRLASHHADDKKAQQPQHGDLMLERAHRRKVSHTERMASRGLFAPRLWKLAAANAKAMKRREAKKEKPWCMSVAKRYQGGAGFKPGTPSPLRQVVVSVS